LAFTPGRYSGQERALKKSRFTEKQIAFGLRQAESGTAIEEITRKLGVSEQTFYRWKKKFAGLGGRSCVGCDCWRRRTASSSSWWLI
jgi:DNA invertase Pin-like site-specific DNA recombinase